MTVSALMGVRLLVVAVNKFDAVCWREEACEAVATAVRATASRRSVDLEGVVVMASCFCLAGAMGSSGLAAGVAEFAVAGLERCGPCGVLLSAVLTTVVLTRVIPNNAAALLIFPVGMAAGVETGISRVGIPVAVTLPCPAPAAVG